MELLDRHRDESCPTSHNLGDVQTSGPKQTLRQYDTFSTVIKRGVTMVALTNIDLVNVEGRSLDKTQHG